ncbi:hypothetical protein D3C77_436030 [compost metagenome]
MVIPPLDEQVEISNFLKIKVDDIEVQEIKVSEVIGMLQEYRAALISNAVTGKIDVRDFHDP